MIKFTVTDEYDAYRIDKYIKEQNEENLYSRTLIDKYIQTEKVSVNGKIVTKKSYPVKTNDEIIINLLDIEQERVEHIQQEPIDLKILYEDEYLAVIDKPSGMTVHPGAGNHYGTLANALLYHFGNNLSNIDSEDSKIQQRAGIVHRLDKDTSGVIIITKDNQTHYGMSQLFMNRLVDKTYLCICLGVPDPLQGTIDKSIGRCKSNRKKMTVDPDGKPAVTHYKTLIDFEYFSLLEVKLETGRTHQIRVHLDSIYHPIIADEVYNSLKRTLGSCPPNKQIAIKMYLNKHIHRQALHAYKVQFNHPRLNKVIQVESALPDDMEDFISFLKNNFTYYQ